MEASGRFVVLWQTALVAAVTVLSMYGGDIIEFTRNLFVLSDAANANKKGP